MTGQEAGMMLSPGAWWLEDNRGGEGPGEEGSCRGGGVGGQQASEAALDERVTKQDVCRGPPLLFYEHLPQEVPARVGHSFREHRLCRLGGDLKNGSHSLELSPRRFLGQHFHNGAGNTPADRVG